MTMKTDPTGKTASAEPGLLATVMTATFCGIALWACLRLYQNGGVPPFYRLPDPPPMPVEHAPAEAPRELASSEARCYPALTEEARLRAWEQCLSVRGGIRNYPDAVECYEPFSERTFWMYVVADEGRATLNFHNFPHP